LPAGPLPALPTPTGIPEMPGPAAPGGPPAGQALGPTHGTLALSLKEAIVRGLRYNPEIAIDRISVEIARWGVDIPRGAFDPAFFGDGSYGKNRDPFFAANPFGGPINPVTGLPAGLVVNPSDVSHLDAGVRAKTILGTSLEMRYDVDRHTTDNVFALSPSWSPVASISVTQPLLRGGPLFPLGTDVNRALVKIARNDHAISEEVFRDRALAVAFAVEQAYWNFVFARENLKVAELALATAADLLEINRRKFQVGRVAEIEVLVAETGVATREEAVIVARNAVGDARDGLFRLIMPRADGVAAAAGIAGSRATAWDVELVALDEPRADDRAIDLDRAFLDALRNRPDYKELELALDSDETRVDKAWNERLPRLDAVGGWSEIGLGKSWGGSTNALADREFYDWTVGFQLEVPIFNTAPRAALRQAELGRTATRRRLDALEQQIVLDVRTAARSLLAARERVRANEIARRLAERQLDNEKQRLEAGLATNHDVLLFEQDLTSARTNYVKALVDRAVAAAQLDRVTATLLERHDIRLER
ncbi:MAG TPA: TolC family protein, partial [Planctomycetota bacterium]|nr:TolC family protein [Planctomycetota bacterium]